MESEKVTAPVVIATEMQELSRHIERWRRNRPHRMPMPEPLWALAANLAGQYGVARIARFLHLDYYTLKERIRAQEPKEAPASASGPTFIELPHLSPSPVAVSECNIELEHPRGSRMRIQVKGAALPDVSALARAFWGMKR